MSERASKDHFDVVCNTQMLMRVLTEYCQQQWKPWIEAGEKMFQNLCEGRCYDRGVEISNILILRCLSESTRRGRKMRE